MKSILNISHFSFLRKNVGASSATSTKLKFMYDVASNRIREFFRIPQSYKRYHRNNPIFRRWRCNEAHIYRFDGDEVYCDAHVFASKRKKIRKCDFHALNIISWYFTQFRNAKLCASTFNVTEHVKTNRKMRTNSTNSFFSFFVLISTARCALLHPR